MFSPTETEEVVTAISEGIDSTVANATWLSLPTMRDMILAFPRGASKAINFFISDSYDVFESLFSGDIRERTVAVATERAGMAMADTGLTAAANAATGGAMSYLRAFNIQQLRTFGGIFNYIISKWAMCCFIVAIILNRTSVYAATRRHPRLQWPARLLMRSIPFVLLVLQIQTVLRGIRCQTSPDFSMMRYGIEDKLVNLDFSQDGGFLYKLSSTLLVGEDDEKACQAVNMLPGDTMDKERPDGSLSLLWPAFKTLCFSKFIENLSSTVQGLPPTTETGMSLFEHSLAYAETESMVGNLIGLGPLGHPSKNGTSDIVEAALGLSANETAAYLSRDSILTKFNTSPEVLLITLISLCNSATSHLLGIVGKQAQFRLINTGIWGICFLGCFIWAFNSFSLERMLDSGVFRFPTVCVVGFLPHLMIVAGIVICAVIYLLALILSVISPPPGMESHNTWTERLIPIYENMQINMQLQNVRINMREDFYTALLRLGLSTLTAASEAVFLNEGRYINLGPRTWLEEERISQILQNRRSSTHRVPTAVIDDRPDAAASGYELRDVTPTGLVQSDKWQSGYARERTTKLLKSNGSLHRASDGVGTLQRHNRISLALDYILKICRLVLGWILLSISKSLDSLRIRYRPAWMRRILEGSKATVKTSAKAHRTHSYELWMLSENGQLSLPKDDDVDVEREMRKRLNAQFPSRRAQDAESDLDSRLYNWFTTNGWWGEKDGSGDFVPPVDEDDTTSIISEATDVSNLEGWESVDENDDGRRTPTQRDHSVEPISQESEALSPADLIRLLDPKDLESRTEARILASHLSSKDIMTRARFKSSMNSSSTRLLTSSRHARPPGFAPVNPNGALTDQEEAEILEFLIIKARKEKAEHRSNSHHDESDAHSGGPQCVVCQGAPRTIMAWPCRCLSLCDDCRVNLAMNNFGNCTCCRQEVVGFSRLFVP